MREFKSFYKTVSGNEGQKCLYPTRLDTYGCGCSHDCKYCYAKSLLEFRDLWNPSDPSIADIHKIENKIKTLKKGTVLRLGGMTDCFQPCENEYKVTFKTIKLLNKYGIHYLIVTKSNLIASDEYIAILNKRLAHIQITVTTTDDKLAETYEHAVPPSKRIKAIEKLERFGFDVQIRLSPFIPEYLDLNIINKINCRKAIIEFLRINNHIEKSFTEIDYSRYKHIEGGYRHLELSDKIELIKLVNGIKEVSVCEDCTQAYEYWKSNINCNANDCCNLKIGADIRENGFEYWGNINLLRQPKTAFLCSSTISEYTQKTAKDWAITQVQNGNCIISGFQSKVEREVLNTLLENGGYAVMLLASNIFNVCPPKYITAINENRLLILSYFENKQPTATRESAEIRNRKVIDLADNLVVGCIKRNGMIEILVNETNKPCFVLDTVRIE